MYTSAIRVLCLCYTLSNIVPPDRKPSSSFPGNATLLRCYERCTYYSTRIITIILVLRIDFFFSFLLLNKS